MRMLLAIRVLWIEVMIHRAQSLTEKSHNLQRCEFSWHKVRRSRSSKKVVQNYFNSEALKL